MSVPAVDGEAGGRERLRSALVAGGRLSRRGLCQTALTRRRRIGGSSDLDEAGGEGARGWIERRFLLDLSLRVEGGRRRFHSRFRARLSWNRGSDLVTEDTRPEESGKRKTCRGRRRVLAAAAVHLALRQAPEHHRTARAAEPMATILTHSTHSTPTIIRETRNLGRGRAECSQRKRRPRWPVRARPQRTHSRCRHGPVGGDVSRRCPSSGRSSSAESIAMPFIDG